MRAESSNMPKPTLVWDYARSAKVPHVCWADDVLHQYATDDQPLRHVNGEVVRTKHYAKHVHIFAWGLVVVNAPRVFDHATAVGLYNLIKV